MAQLKYNGETINSTLSDIDLLGNRFELLATDIKTATTKIISAKGFTDYIGGLSVDSFSSAVEECKSVVDELIHTVRQQQIMILSFSDDGEEIKAFLASLSRKEFDELDFSALEKYITVDVKAGKILSSTGATIATFGVSLVEGVLDFVETAADLVVMAGTAVASIFTGLYDLFTGSNVTEKMWEGTKTWVADKKVENIFDSFYANTTVGRWMKDNAYGYDTVRSIGKGVGYTAGVVAVTILTFGAGGAAIGAGGAASAATSAAAASGGTLLSAAGGITAGELAVTAGVMGVSSGAEDAWADGATIENGLKYGIANGIWEGAQWYAGGKIAKIGSGASGVVKRIALDTADAGLEGFAQPALTTIYKDYGGSSYGENYSKAFEAAGGWKNVATQAAIGAVSSTAGELGEIKKIIKDKKTSIGTVALGGAATLGAEHANKIFNNTADTIVKPVDVSGSTTKNVNVVSNSISENVDNSSKVVVKNTDVKAKSAKVVVAGEGATLGVDNVNNIFKSTTDTTVKPVDVSGSTTKNVNVISNSISENIDNSSKVVKNTDVKAKSKAVAALGVDDATELFKSSKNVSSSSTGVEVKSSSYVSSLVDQPSKKISGTNIVEEVPFKEQINAQYPNGYERYKGSYLPKDSVIDDISVVRKVGNGDTLAGIERIEKIFGRDSIEASTARGVAVQDFLKNTDASYASKFDYDTTAKRYNYYVAQRSKEVFDSAGISGRDLTFDSMGPNAATYKGYSTEVADSIFKEDFAKWKEIEKTNPEIYDAMQCYTGFGYSKMNDIMRGNLDSSFNQNYVNKINTLSDALENNFSGISERTIIYRGIDNLNFFADGVFQGKRGAELVDAVNSLGGGVFSLTDNGFGSTTPVMGEGFTNSKNVVVVTSVPEGTKGAWVGKNSECAWECEYLLQAGYGNKQMILGAEKIGEKVFIYTEMI